MSGQIRFQFLEGGKLTAMTCGLGRAARISTNLSTALLFRLMECHAPLPDLCFGKFSNSATELLTGRPNIFPKHLTPCYFALVNTGKALFMSSTDFNRTSSCRECPSSFQHRSGRFATSASPLQRGQLIISSKFFFPLHRLWPVEQRAVEQYYFAKTPAMTLRLAESQHLEPIII